MYNNGLFNIYFMSESSRLSDGEVGFNCLTEGSAVDDFAGIAVVPGRLENSDSGVRKVSSLRYLILLAVLVAMAGCKDFGKKRGFKTGKSGGRIELYDPNAGKGGGGFYVDSTGRMIFGEGDGKSGEKGEVAGTGKGKSVEKGEGVGAGSGAGKSGEKGEVVGAGSDAGKGKEKSGGKDGSEGAGVDKGSGVASGGGGDEIGGKNVAVASNAEGAESPVSAEDLIKRTLVEGYIKKVITSRVKSSDIVLPSKDVERDVTFSSSGREVTVRIKIPASHLAGVKSRLMGTVGSPSNQFFIDTGEYMDEETLRRRFLAAETADWVRVGSSNLTVNPGWSLPVSIDDSVLVGLTKAVTGKFTTKRGKMQAITDFAAAAVKYVGAEKRHFSKFPLLTLADGFGDCKDFSVLAAVMGRIVEVDCAFADFRDEEHLDVACALDGEGAAFTLGGVKYEWLNVTTFLSMYGPNGMGIQTNHDGIGVLPDAFGSPEYLQPVSGKPVAIKELVASGKLVLNEDRQKWDERSAGKGGKTGKGGKRGK